MNVALLADTAYLDEELTWFQHLAVGLVDERVRVVAVTPQDLGGEASALCGECVVWPESRWNELNRWRIARLADRLRESDVDLIHALDARVWRGAAALGDAIGVPVVYGANAAGGADEAERLTRGVDPARFAFAAATAPIAETLRTRLHADAAVETVPTGAPPAPTSPGCDEDADMGEDASMCTIVSGNGVLDADYQALLNALAEVVERHPQMQFFFDGQGSDQHAIWRAARRLNLLKNLSLVPRRLGHREILLRADVLLHPQPLGQSRSITLQAMAHGLTVLAHDDPWLDYLRDGETARVLREPIDRDWASALFEFAETPGVGASLGQRAKAWVSEHRSVSDGVARLVHLYRRLAGESLPFPG